MTIYVGLVSTGSYEDTETKNVYAGDNKFSAIKAVENYGPKNSAWSEYDEYNDVNSRLIETWKDEKLIDTIEIEDKSQHPKLIIHIRNRTFFIHNEKLLHVAKELNIGWLLFPGKYAAEFIKYNIERGYGDYTGHYTTAYDSLMALLCEINTTRFYENTDVTVSL